MAQPLSVTGSADDSALISINVIGDEVTYEWQYAETSSTT